MKLVDMLIRSTLSLAFALTSDAIGTGKSSKPSDGLRTRFPKYNYDDMVDAQ
jgi:homoserine O-acetyltransferase